MRSPAPLSEFASEPHFAAQPVVRQPKGHVIDHAVVLVVDHVLELGLEDDLDTSRPSR
ncbi:hypothetical protein [Mycobacterium tuberculosis]|uniref:hypothetical protein n=1 Tax=Mycobacterium tuberculosis TaxID=1773 RepID=UPI00272B52D8|nr:hypothetical protein [Mycobacterium tuberculosis]